MVKNLKSFLCKNAQKVLKMTILLFIDFYLEKKNLEKNLQQFFESDFKKVSL